MFRKSLFAAVASFLLGVALVAPAESKASVSARGSISNYAVFYKKADGKWTYYGTFDSATAQRLTRQLSARGFEVSLRSAGSVRSPLNTRKAPQERAKVVASKAFPYLGENFEVLGPATKQYNCIAWSCGITGRWVWPGKSVAKFDKLYAQHGYRRVKGLDYRKQAGVEKVVLYGHIKTVNGRKTIECTHASRQLKDGTWSSKLGQLPLIRHLTPDSIDGFESTQYGRPVAVYVRQARS